MSLEARKKKKERFIERAKRLRFIKAKALKKMGGRVMKPQQAELGSSSSPDPDGRDGGTKRQERKRQGIPSTRKDQKRGEKPTSSTSRERNSKHDDKRNTTTSSTMKKKMKKFASEGPSKDELAQKVRQPGYLLNLLSASSPFSFIIYLFILGGELSSYCTVN